MAVSNITMVLKSIMDAIAVNLNSGAVIYSPNSSGIVDVYSSKRHVAEKGSPVFGWSRSPLRKAESLNMRAANCVVAPGGSVYNSVLGELIIQWTIFFPHISELEAFELGYVTQDPNGLYELKTHDVDHGDDVGVHDYSLDWSEIENIDVDHGDVTTLSVTGTVNIRGMFFTTTDKTLSQILSVETDVYDEIRTTETLLAHISNG